MAHKFFINTQDAWEAMLSACEEAEVSIDIEQYIFNNDEIGSRFLEIFIKKRKEGVRVRIICDAVGSYNFLNSYTPTELGAIGIEIRFFNIISSWRIPNMFSWYFRDHRKILLVDDHIGFTGGVGIREGMRPWRDTHVEISGPIVREMKSAFEEMWTLTAEKSIFARIKRSRLRQRGLGFVTNAPYPKRRFLYYRFIEAIRSAREYIFLTSPYLVPDPKFMRALKSASRRGVDVRVIVPRSSDVALVNRASHSFFDELLSHGIRIFQYSGRFIHAKTAIIDDEWSTVGSFNFDNFSFTYNHEANIISSEQSFIRTLKNHFRTDTEQCDEITLKEWRARPILWKLREFFVLPIRRFL